MPLMNPCVSLKSVLNPYDDPSKLVPTSSIPRNKISFNLSTLSVLQQTASDQRDKLDQYKQDGHHASALPPEA